jgi:hypothetical protein
VYARTVSAFSAVSSVTGSLLAFTVNDRG